MIELEAALYSGDRLLNSAIVRQDEPGLGFHGEIQEAFIELCKRLGSPLPLWLSKNTQELAAFHQTYFSADQFDEAVLFDRMHLRFLGGL